MSTRSRILEALAKFAPRPVNVPDLGGVVYVRRLTISGMARIHGITSEPMARHQAAVKALAEAPDSPEAQAAERATALALQLAHERTSTLLLIDCVVDEHGAPIFNPGDESQVAALPAHVAEPLLVAIDQTGSMGKDSSGEAAGN